MAGEGQRYKDAGFIIPKPFIDVDGIPMVVRACKALPQADKNIFVCRKHHLEDYPIKDILEKYLNNVVVVTIDELTEGQAITCMAARDYIPDDAILNIGASDNDMIYDERVVDEMYKNTDLDGWIWTFRDKPSVSIINNFFKKIFAFFIFENIRYFFYYMIIVFIFFI